MLGAWAASARIDEAQRRANGVEVTLAAEVAAERQRDLALADLERAEARIEQLEERLSRIEAERDVARERADTYRDDLRAIRGELRDAEAALDAVVVPAPVSTEPAPAALPDGAVRVVDGDTLFIGDVEIRVGLVNTPERGEGCADEATAFARDFLGGRASYHGYATDTHGRTVAEVFAGDGSSLNVAIAASALSDDRYVAEFAHENPDLARRVRAAYVPPKAGCFDAPAPPPPAAPDAGCHWAYVTCIPVKGDGSGNGSANDLDCGDIRKRVQLKRIGDDPYRLDGSDNDGWGCESYG